MFWVNEKLQNAAQHPNTKLLSFDGCHSSERWGTRHILLTKNV